MSDKTIYLKMDTKVKIASEKIYIGDLGKIYCEDTKVKKKKD